MNRIAFRANITLVIAILLLAGFAFFLVEYASEAGGWVVSEGSPHVYSGTNIGCGTVTDRDGVLLLDMNGSRTYSNLEQIRSSTVHWVGDRYGNVDAPALTKYSEQMAGYDILTGVYQYGEDGSVAQLTLSAKVQTAALEAMGDRKGTVGVYNYKTGELICAVSTPSFDPDNVPEVEGESAAYEGMYLNRFVQSVYIPGSIFKLVTLTAALETIPDIQEQTFTCQGSYKIGNNKVTCTGVHRSQNLKTAFRNSCNCAFAQIVEQLGGETLERYVQKLGITQSVSFDGITTAKGNYDLTDAGPISIAWSGIGQHTDQINACTFMTYVGAIAGGGQGAQPYLVERITAGGEDTYTAQTKNGGAIMSRETAKTIKEYMAFNVQDKYGAENFPGMTVCAKTGTGEVGGGKKPNAVLTGFVQDEQYPLAFIVIVEEGGYGADACIPIASSVLAACKEVLD